MPSKNRASAPANDSAGISNRDPHEEERRDEQLPPRGTAQGETDPVLRPRPDERPAPRDPAPKQRKAKTPPPE